MIQKNQQHNNSDYLSDKSNLISWAQKNKQERNGKISEIIPNLLFLGNKFASKDLGLLKNLKIKCIVNIGGGKPAFQQEFEYLKNGTLDNENANIKEFLGVSFEFIREKLEKNQPVFVHCQQGINRSPSVVIGFLVNYFGFQVQEGLEYVRLLRPKVCPREQFIQQIEEFSKEFQDKQKGNQDKEKQNQDVQNENKKEMNRNDKNNQQENK
ncbi:hypothetical protein PPERSA_05354 [Pseudocohnilembus persalinus]|uniref:protein-tyrosine-phosphatase n=1 Tax=Pseudocohnilembus persalinus TaxID=266149 RepID=A0A0V0R7T5_PSEPJ|nr:hypothetical protein PPERSA_05354 [Pseudocohnilembus persalinus]|eukprot:KRX10534.1 hypothetical protein PPERSA_05354 [Pseudocohnilembus persalinus]